MQTALAESPHPGIDACVAKNPRLGFRVVFADMYPAINEVKPKNASGMEAEVRRKGVRSRCTGKERDQETGLDFFGARYFSGAQGRFTSPDSVDHPSKSSVALNNPFRYTDQNGTEAASIYLGGNRYFAGGQIVTVPQRSLREHLAIAAAPAVAMGTAIFAPEALWVSDARFLCGPWRIRTRCSKLRKV